MSSSSRQHALNLYAALLGFGAWVKVVARPCYRLVHRGLKPHGSFAEDFDFYQLLVANIFWNGGQYLGLTCCILGMSAALGSKLGFVVNQRTRSRARTLFWVTPIFCFCAELLGRYFVQVWYAERGIRFPSTAFLQDFLPHLWWLGGVWLLTAPAILTGKGIYLVEGRDLRGYYTAWRAREKTP